MKLREKINKDYIKAFKEKDIVSKSLLSVVKGDIQTMEKNINAELSDEEVIKILLKSAKSLKEMVKSGSEEAILELSIIESYLPQQMSEEEIRSKIKGLIEGGSTNIGSIMKGFSNLSADKKMVSSMAKELLK